MKTKITLLMIASAFSFYSCEWLGLDEDKGSVDIVKGLKTALQVGKDSAVKFTSATDGFYQDALIKILLPPEAQIIYTVAAQYPLLVGSVVNPLIANMELTMNRAAEYAAPRAKSIFSNTIDNMTITDGLTILNGTNPADTTLKSGMTGDFDSLAASHYLRSTTFTQLTDAFSPPMDSALDKDLVGSVSANEAWDGLVTGYNSVASLAGEDPIATTSLGVFATGKALDGLFVKVGDQERLIRRDPYHWAASAVGDILTSVFGKK